MALMNKPEVIKKVHAFMHNVRKNGNRIGKTPRSMAINYNNLCNFKCDFCYSSDPTNKHLKKALSFETIKDLADQAHELGIWEILLQGGELTVNKPKLLKLLETIGPERFQTVLVTNGYLLTQEYADDLAKAGLDCVAVSVSGLDAKEHDESRHVPGAHAKALEALKHAKNAGMAAWPNVIFGHHNAFSEDLIAMLEYAKEHKYSTYLLMAMPYGSYKDSALTPEDMKRLNWLRKNYDCFFDTWDMYDRKKEAITGCWSVNRTYVSPYGDVFPCPFIPIRIGNILDTPLKDILDYGFSIKYFGGYSPVCIAACNKEFRKKYIRENADVFDFDDAKDVFSSDALERRTTPPPNATYNIIFIRISFPFVKIRNTQSVKGL